MQQKILFLVSSLELGGAERVATTLANAWAAHGHTVTLVATYAGRGECRHQLSAKVRLSFLADHVGREGRGALAFARRLIALRRLVQAERPHTVVSFLSRVNVAAIASCWGLRVRVIVSERTYPPQNPIGRLWEAMRRVAYPRASCVVMQTKEGLEWLHSAIPKAIGACIPNPVIYPLPSQDSGVGPTELVGSGRRLLLAVGRLDAGKQFDHLLEAFAGLAVRFPDWDLVVLGEGPERQRLENLAKEHGLLDRVMFPGQTDRPGEWYHRADLYALSSRFEGFPNSLLEAMAHGCAAISYDCDTGPRDIIRHELDGLLVSPAGDRAALGRALERLMANDGERRRMAERAVDVRERFSADSILRLWGELLAVDTRHSLAP